MIGSRALTIAAFAFALVVLAGVEWAARRERSAVPTLGAICGFVMGYRVGRLPVGRIAILGFWWWLGWHFFAR